MRREDNHNVSNYNENNRNNNKNGGKKKHRFPIRIFLRTLEVILFASMFYGAHGAVEFSQWEAFTFGTYVTCCLAGLGHFYIPHSLGGILGISICLAINVVGCGIFGAIRIWEEFVKDICDMF